MQSAGKQRRLGQESVARVPKALVALPAHPQHLQDYGTTPCPLHPSSHSRSMGSRWSDAHRTARQAAPHCHSTCTTDVKLWDKAPWSSPMFILHTGCGPRFRTLPSSVETNQSLYTSYWHWCKGVDLLLLSSRPSLSPHSHAQ